MVSTSAACDSRQAKLTLLSAHLGLLANALSMAYLLSSTLTSSHSSVLKKVQTFSSLPFPLLGSSVLTGTPAEREIRVGAAHTPSHSGHQAAPSCCEYLHLPGLLQHLEPLRLLKLGLRCQQDVPLPGRGATVYLREGRSEDTEATPRPPQAQFSPTPHPCG